MTKKTTHIHILLYITLFSALFLGACSTSVSDKKIDKQVPIWPDYTSCTFPPNIAAPNFQIKEPHEKYRIKIYNSKQEYCISLKGKDLVSIPLKKWKHLLDISLNDSVFFDIELKQNGQWVSFNRIWNFIAADSIDPYMVCRRIEPSYQLSFILEVEQRCLENYQVKVLFNNMLLEGCCVNCHTFGNNDPEKMLYHVRFNNTGTYILKNGKMTRVHLPSERFSQGGVYPAWHPDGNLIAFATGKAVPFVHSLDINRRTEVFDSLGDIFIYDIARNRIVSDERICRQDVEETFPCFSPDGTKLYFCRSLTPARDSGEDFTDYSKKIHYDLACIDFDKDSMKFGELTTLIDCSEGKSVSFPRVSPDGNYLVFCLSDHGTFPIRHPESDLYILDLKSGKYEVAQVLNSNKTESYHTWSSNGRWLVFSSKRTDGMYSQPFFAYFDRKGKFHKPFLLPQKNPNYYLNTLKSFNVPELVKGPVNINPQKSADATNQAQIRPSEILINEVP